MARKNQLPKLIFGAAAAWAILRSAKGAYKHEVAEEVMKYRNKMYDVGPNCEITMKGGAAGGDDAAEDLKDLWSEFAYPIVKESWDKGEASLDQVTSALMRELFPEEQCVWPPVPASPPTQKSAYYLMMVFVANQLGCGYDGAPVVGEGYECYEESISEETANALTTNGIVLGMMAQGMGGVPGLKEAAGTYTISYRAPMHGG